MLIGFDFDNTIVNYDLLFHRLAVERELIPSNFKKSKLAVRDHLRKIGKEDQWTEMQGYVYGDRMSEAVAYPDAIEFMRHARGLGIEMAIVSHKTLFPFQGPQFDLHAAARGWVEKNLRDSKGAPLIPADRVFFELTKPAKIGRIQEIRCDYFIDDLPEILLMPEFPDRTARLLFDPDGHHSATELPMRLSSWAGIREFFEARWKSKR